MIYGDGLLGNIYGAGLNPGLVALLIVRCIPCVNITALTPSLALSSNGPAIDVAQTIPTLDLVQMAPALALVATIAGLEVAQMVPVLAVEECDC